MLRFSLSCNLLYCQTVFLYARNYFCNGYVIYLERVPLLHQVREVKPWLRRSVISFSLSSHITIAVFDFLGGQERREMIKVRELIPHMALHRRYPRQDMEPTSFADVHYSRIVWIFTWRRRDGCNKTQNWRTVSRKMFQTFSKRSEC